MFERFGEFDTVEEINKLAENLFNEGDMQSIKELAEENGIGEEYVEMFVNGDIPILADAMTAALGKIEIEEAELKPKAIMVDWIEYIRGQIMESEDMAKAVRQKGKSIKKCIAELLKWSFANQIDIDKDIVKAAGVTAQKVTLGIPGMAEAQKIIRDYYGE